MTLGYEGKLYILAFDHRGSFQKKFFGVEGAPSPEDVQRIIDAKTVIFEGMQRALAEGADAGAAGVLVDEQFGTAIAGKANELGLMLAMPVEKSGQEEFDFEYGSEFGAHIQAFNPAFSKVLVRYNPEGDGATNARQSGRLKELSDWLHHNERRFLFELLVPAEPRQLESVGGDGGRYDREVRPSLMRVAIAELQEAGIEPDIWKIEGIDDTADCEAIVDQCRIGGRDQVACVVFGPRRRRRGRGRLVARSSHGSRLLRVRDRTIDLVGAALGLRQRRAPSRTGRRTDREQLSEVRRRLRARLRRQTMAVIKTIDLVGVSEDSWRDAAHQALAEAAKTIRGIEGMDVLETSARVEDGQISEYHTHVQIRFRIER